MKSGMSVGLIALTLFATVGTATAQSDAWIQQAPSPTWFNLPGICMMSETEAWLVGSAQLTTNIGDESWTVQNIGTSASVWGVSAVSSSECWVVLLDGAVRHTEDGGATWREEIVTNEPSAVLETIAFSGMGTGWVAGNKGIYHRGRNPADARDAPLSLGPTRLALPFPNPASGPVTIRYEMPRETGSSAAFEILDIAGRRVRKFALAHESIGSGEITWDGKDARGRDVPAGRYYLRVEGTSGTGVEITRLH